MPGERRIYEHDPAAPILQHPVTTLGQHDPIGGDHRALLVPARIDIDGAEGGHHWLEEGGRRKAAIAIDLIPLPEAALPRSAAGPRCDRGEKQKQVAQAAPAVFELLEGRDRQVGPLTNLLGGQALGVARVDESLGQIIALGES